VRRFMLYFLKVFLRHKVFWIQAEISKINFHNSGHCYIDLVELYNNKILSKAKANLWSFNQDKIRQEIGNDFTNIFKKGNKILVNVKVVYHQIHGLSLDIKGVDLKYSIGEIEIRRKATIKKLTDEKIIGNNKLCKVPKVLSNFVVIGAKDSDGYKDFRKEILQNEFKYKYDFGIINSLVQGDKAAHQITKYINLLQNYQNELQAIILVRGGGSKLDLEPFNDYNLAKSICLSKIPVLTGIGHDEDISVVDLCSFKYYKTPSALGKSIIVATNRFETKQENKFNTIITNSRLIYKDQNELLNNHINSIHTKVTFKTGNLRHHTSIASSNLDKFTKQKTRHMRHLVSMATKNIQNLHTKIKNDYSNKIELNKEKIFTRAFSILQQSELSKIDNFNISIKRNSEQLLKFEDKNILHFEKVTEFLDPVKLLEKGYAIVSDNNGYLKRTSKLKNGDVLKIRIYDYELICEIIKTDEKWILNLTKKLQKNFKNLLNN